MYITTAENIDGVNWGIAPHTESKLCSIGNAGQRTVSPSEVKRIISHDSGQKLLEKDSTNPSHGNRVCKIGKKTTLPAINNQEMLENDQASMNEVKYTKLKLGCDCVDTQCEWSTTSSNIHVKKYDQAKLPCEFVKYGCTITKKRADLDLHQLNCDYWEEECQNHCGIKYSIKNKKVHNSSCLKECETFAITMTRQNWQALTKTIQGQTSSSTKEATKSYTTEVYAEFRDALQKKKPIATTCPYQCGTLIQGEGDLSRHDAICPEMTIDCHYSCGAKPKRKELAKHYETCRLYPVPCPRKCGVELIKENIQNKSHDNSCQKMPVTFDDCHTQSKMQGHVTHKSAHRLSTLLFAGIEYKPQEGAVGNVYQSSIESKEYCTHVCMPIEIDELIQSLQEGGNSQTIRKRLGISEQMYQENKGLIFTVANYNYEVYFNDDYYYGEVITGIYPNIGPLHISVINLNGKKLCSFFNHYDNHSFYHHNNHHFVNESSLQALRGKDNQTVCLVMSRQPYDNLLIPNTETGTETETGAETGAETAAETETETGIMTGLWCFW